MTLRLPDVKASAGLMDRSGTVVYQGDSASTAVQVLDKGAVRALVTLVDQRAPSAYRFEFGAPTGLTLSAIEGGQGSIAIVGVDGLPLGVVDAPWAKDARGVTLQTWYEIQGNAIVQHINTAGAAYPIVADPTHWWGYSIDMSSTTANQISAALAVGAGVSAIVAIFAAGSIAGIPGSVVYGVAAGILAIGAAGFQFLNAGGRGVSCKWTWVGFAGCYGR